MPDLGYNVAVHLLDDGDRLTMESLPWINELAGTQTGENFTMIKFPNGVFDFSLCSPYRETFLTGWRSERHGVYRHGNAPQDGSADPGAATRFVAAGTPGNWFNTWTKEDQLPYWMRRCHRSVYFAGKWLNNNGWGTDARIPRGVDRAFIILDDSDLGGAHATHQGSLYLGNSTPSPGAGTMVFVIDDAGTLESHTAGSDPYTNVGYTSTAFAGRVGGTDYVTDLLNRKFRQFLDGTSGPKMTEPFFAVQSHRASHALWLPATRHAASSVFVTGSSGTALATDGSTDPAGFNEADITDKSAWYQADKPLLNSTQIAGARNDRITKARTSLAFDEAVHDAWFAAKNLSRPTVHIITSDNGFALGQNRDYLGKVSPYAPSQTAPVFVIWPFGTGRRTESTLVTSADIPALICAIAGATPSVAPDGRGHALLRVIDGTDPTGTQIRTHAPFLFTSSNEFIQPSYRGVQTATKRLWWNAPYADPIKATSYPGFWEAYDLSTDPGEQTNVFSSASWVPDLAARLAHP